MPSLENAKLRLNISNDAQTIELVDRRRNFTWELDTRHSDFQRYGADKPERLSNPTLRTRDGAITVKYAIDQGEIAYTWSLQDDHLVVSLDTNVTGVEHIALPRSFRAAEGSQQLAAPVYQGLLVTPSPDDWQLTLGHHGHMGCTMAMAGMIGKRGGLLVTHDAQTNWKLRFGQQDSRPYAFFMHQHCPVEGWVEATVRIYPVEANLVSICKRYRARLKELGRFVGWQEKITAKPIVEDLFGAVIAFIGYNQTRDIDYVASAKKFKAYGFDNIFYYPARFCCHSNNFKMGGDDPIFLSDDQIAQLHAIEGTHVSPWGWVIESLDEDSAPQRRHGFRHDREGKAIPNWKIDDFQWYWNCTPYQVDLVKQKFAGDMRGMDWIHFDVNAMLPGMACFNTAHEHHDCKPMGRRADLKWTQRLFGSQTVGNRIVSSEGFGDHYAGFYDIGATKMTPPAEGTARYTVVPMTSLVLHDSCIQDWWEIHNYNQTMGFAAGDLMHGLGQTGSGVPKVKAAVDALHGYPPNLFPFGKQYAWSNFEKRESYSYLVRLEDQEVQDAIAAALPVAKLHGKIGKLEMVDFQILSQDNAVQSTTFADGTRVVANLVDEDREVDGLGVLPGHSWRVASEG